MKPSEVLAKAADLIEPVGAWTQRTSYRDAKGRICEPRSPAVACRCAAGAINEACDWSYDLACPTFVRFEGFIGASTARWNDTYERTQAEVVKALRDAADLARSEGQ
jgi:hypothetical protein